MAPQIRFTALIFPGPASGAAAFELRTTSAPASPGNTAFGAVYQRGKKRVVRLAWLSAVLLALPGCAHNLPTLVEVARARQNPPESKNAPNATYHITDRDVLDYANQVKVTFSRHFDGARFARYGSTVSQTTLAALAGAASAAGWAVSVASGLGAGSAFISAVGANIDAKGDAQAYETAFTDIQRAEANFYFYRLGGKFTGPDTNGKKHVEFSGISHGTDIPSDAELTPDGEALYYRLASIIKVTEDVLAKKIPDLQTLKDAKGDASSTVNASPIKGSGI